MKIINYSHLRANLAKIMDKVTSSKEVYTITRAGSKPAVIIGQQHYDELEKKLNKEC